MVTQRIDGYILEANDRNGSIYRAVDNSLVHRVYEYDESLCMKSLTKYLNKLPKFKVGDIVYCPMLTTKPIALDAYLSIHGVRFHADGTLVSKPTYPMLYEATESNRQLLSNLTGLEFDRPSIYQDMLKHFQTNEIIVYKNNGKLKTITKEKFHNMNANDFKNCILINPQTGEEYA